MSVPGPGKRTLTGELGAGEGLPGAQRSTFEQSLGRDLSGVRVHTNDAAANEAERVDAQAYASGQDIVFIHTGGAPALFAYRHLFD